MVYFYSGVDRWAGFGDWIGTGTIQTQQRKYRSFHQARKYIRKLGLKSYNDYQKYRRGTFPEKGKLPRDIPSNPIKVYGDQWTNLGDYLGYRVGFSQWREFEKARSFVHDRNLKSGEEWKKYCDGELPSKVKLPIDIPKYPIGVYRRKGWQSMGDWLGTGRVATIDIQFRPFVGARSVVCTLNLTSVAEWRRYSKGQFPNKGKKPDDIPAAPDRTYKEEWVDWGDWLGTGRVSYWSRELRPFSEAREFARSLGLHKASEWTQFCKGELPDKGTKPDDIAASPDGAYKNKGWKGWGDWLGTGFIAASNRTFRPFDDARSFVRGLGLRSQGDWSSYCKGEMPELGIKPIDIPGTPRRSYKKDGWAGFGDWLGTGNVSNRDKSFRPFKEARKYSRALRLKDQADWQRFSSGGKRPDDVPRKPDKVYAKDGWTDWSDWLGNKI